MGGDSRLNTGSRMGGVKLLSCLCELLMSEQKALPVCQYGKRCL